ncbi:MAG: beta-lactamase family protein [Rhodospirillales bacterium]|nr:beta-lactamase family protein [Rhodospirillales bacterium]MDH3790557.1 beta-lactamase family protein [Rhodospirillales bacterium]MDH3913667.1 beta-lactamase family protein [Rhodospirillales bacterium]MDH3918296.1 beta-lactamase family protein [Rhodospirillales bacterium]
MTVCGLGPNSLDSLAHGEPPKYSQFCPAPEPKDDDWRRGLPSAHGLETANIEDLMRAARAGALGKLHSVLVVKDGVLVVEEYFHGASRDHCQLIASVTKSLVSILVGMSLERSLEWTVDTPLVDFFPQYADAMAQDGKSAITLANALTMTAGLDWDEYTYPHPDDRNPNTQMYKKADPKGFILGRKLIHPPGETWTYNSGLSVILGATVRRMTGRSIDKFAEAELFEPLGIDRYHWFKHADGTVYSNGDLLLTPRDLAKIGLLVLNQGEWQGRRIVSQSWIAESTRRYTTTRNEFGYGYQWRLGTVVRGERRFGIIFGSGTGGQKMFIVPDLKMVVVITAQVFGNSAGDVAALRVLADYLIPAALPTRPQPQVARPDATFLEAAIGNYVDPKSGHTVRVIREDTTLFAKPSSHPKLPVGPDELIEFTPSAPRRFHGYWSQAGNIVVDFNLDAAGTVIGLTANVLLADRAYQKTDQVSLPSVE